MNPPLTYDDQWIEDALCVARAGQHCSCHPEDLMHTEDCNILIFQEKFEPPTVEGMLLELKRLREACICETCHKPMAHICQSDECISAALRTQAEEK